MEPIPAVNVGEKIKAIRTSQHISLRALSEKSGISINALSLIERNKTSPTVTTLSAIAKAFDIELSQFFSVPEGEKGNYVVFKCGNGKENRPTEVLATNVEGQNLNLFLVRLEGRERFCEDLGFHPGDEFVYCLSGQIECEVGEDKVMLRPGDAITYKSEIPHTMKNLAVNGSDALVVFDTGRERYHDQRLHRVGHATMPSCGPCRCPVRRSSNLDEPDR